MDSQKRRMKPNRIKKSKRQTKKPNRMMITFIKYLNLVLALVMAIQVLGNLKISIQLTAIVKEIMDMPEYTLEVTQNSSVVQKQQQQQQPNKLAENSSVVVQQQQQQKQLQEHELPWFGWQPRISTDPTCSWTQCFQRNHHGCKTTCRDENLGETPLPIKPVPPPNARIHDSEKYWIPDVTMLHRMRMNGKDADGNVWPPSLPEELCDANVTILHRKSKDQTLEEKINDPHGQTNFEKVLFDSVPINVIDNNNDGLSSPSQQQQQRVDDDGPTILCLIYTMNSQHSTRIRAIRETWGNRCNGFLAFSTKSDPRIPAISIQHDGPEKYDNMWQKVRSIWKFVGTYYNKQFDYYMIGGDDLFFIPENARHYLSKYHTNPTTNHYYIGRRFRIPEDRRFNTGGPGYILSQATLNSFISVIDHPNCEPRKRISAEDVLISQCLNDVLNISFVDTRDEQGRERFHHLTPAQHLLYETKKVSKTKKESDWYENYNRDWGLKLGVDCCAPDSISFHFIKKPAMLRHLYSLLYICKKENI